MNRETIETFLAAANLESVSAAAKILYVSQSTVSYRLQKLEEELKTKLFYRERGFKHITLTESGRKLVPLASQWIELDSTIYSSLADSSLGKVTIGSMDSLNQYLINELIFKVKKAEPKLNLQFVSFHSQEIYSRLSSGQLDIGFAFHPVHYKINAVPVFSEPLYMICPVNSIYPEGPTHPLALEKANEIFFQWNPQIRDWNDKWWDASIPPYVRVDSTALLKTFLTEPYNWAICPASVATAWKKQGHIEMHEFTVTPPNRICYLLQKSGNDFEPTKATEVFLKNFHSVLEGHPWRYIE